LNSNPNGIDDELFLDIINQAKLANDEVLFWRNRFLEEKNKAQPMPNLEFIKYVFAICPNGEFIKNCPEKILKQLLDPQTNEN
jgi:hypothetical protein